MPEIPTPPLAETGCRLSIDLGALADNWRLIARHAADAECAAVVKADAYGLGIEPAVKALWKAGARTFFVAHLFEARRVRAVAPEAVVYVLNGLPPGMAGAYRVAGVRPVLGSRAEIEEWRAEGGAAALHVDTGMNRLGLAPEELAGCDGFTPSLIMSHLACADTPEHGLNARQLGDFRAVLAQFPGVPASLANSAASLGDSAFHFDLCRPGVALYGGNPFAERDVPLRPVVWLEGRVIQVRDVAAGESVGYGAAQRVQRDTRIAILSAGYADGLFRALGSEGMQPGADVRLHGHRCPYVGRVSMDLIAVDVTDAPATARGDWAAFLDDVITVDELSARAHTIPYEILTALGRRHHRVYIEP